MTLTKVQHQEFVTKAQQKLLPFNQLVVDGATYTQKKMGKYTSTFVGNKGAEYLVLVTGSYTIINFQDLPVYEISRRGKTIASFVVFNSQIVSL